MTGELRLVRSIRAPVSDLWSAFTTTQGLERWYADRASGTLGPGGGVRLEWPELLAVVNLEVVEWVPEQRVAFQNNRTRVTVTMTEGQVELTHTGLRTADDLEGFRSSWQVGLSLLGHSLEAHPGLARRSTWFARRARTRPSLAHLCFTEPEALGAWLGRDASMGHEGADYSVELSPGHRMSGRVLARVDGRDVALSLRDHGNSALTLRTLPSPASAEERLVAVCWSRWGPAGPDERRLEHEFRRAVDRLASILQKSGAA